MLILNKSVLIVHDPPTHKNVLRLSGGNTHSSMANLGPNHHNFAKQMPKSDGYFVAMLPQTCHKLPITFGKFVASLSTNLPQTSHIIKWQVCGKFGLLFQNQAYFHKVAKYLMATLWQVCPQSCHKLPILNGKFVANLPQSCQNQMGSLWQICHKVVISAEWEVCGKFPIKLPNNHGKFVANLPQTSISEWEVCGKFVANLPQTCHI